MNAGRVFGERVSQILSTLSALGIWRGPSHRSTTAAAAVHGSRTPKVRRFSVIPKVVSEKRGGDVRQTHEADDWRVA
ncbi:hypothetical protein V6Z12_D12G237300 [Gossypium hirsutum]